ncbi:hypothetical protein BU23DRAFT_263093 [Bimuria novae-zelandiae CBS 107.79]|uniref:Uncharacterized protein n=1 Tax=Bimuria novae-zelandiae CBS 107.79 TaxID=1447943 RepID=A0A6A5V035_9PLEO|nr:hypothetical protein BU23DRAFT_263093 [Bimuria novae-zelandiae CBS 107.79]
MDKDTRIEIHHSDRMQASAEIANKPMKTVTSQENTDSPNASKGDMLTLRYVDSTEGALSRPHWVLVDRSKSKHDPLLGLRGLRPQIGSMPKLVDFKSGKDFFTRNGTFGGTVAATKGRSGDCTKTPRDSIGNRATAAVGNIRHSSERRTSTRRTKSAVDTSVVEAQVANSGAKASTSNKFRSSSTGASGSRDKGRIAFQQILVDGRAESLSLKRLSHLSQEVAASPKHKRIGSRTSGACTRVNAIGTTTDIPIESVDATVEEQETVTDTEEEDTISESEVESEATNSRVSPDSRAQQPKPSAAIDIPVFGRRAKLLARAAARQAVLAKLTTDESVSVSAEAHRIAQQRNDPNYDEGKAVATAVANRDRGLRPRAPPRTSTHEDDEGSDDDDVEEGEEDEEEGEYFDDDDGIYTEPAGRTQHMNPNHKRRRQRDNKADYVPAKMARKSLTAPSGRRRANTTDTRSPSARQSHTASLAPEVASTSTSSNSNSEG